MLEALFKLRERQASLWTEFIGGVKTFITMACIMVVNPAIVSFAGIPAGPGTVARLLAAGMIVLALLCAACCLFGLPH